MTSRPLRVLVVIPSWVGDAVMATPALRYIRESMPGALIGGLMRPGVVGVLADAGGDRPLLDEVHISRPTGVLGPKLTGFKLRPMRYETALLLTNSFSTALSVRVAGIDRRIGYDRDARGVLLTDRVEPQRLADGSWTIVPAVRSYMDLARYLVQGECPTPMPEMTSNTHADMGCAEGRLMELGTSAGDESAAESALREAGIEGPFCLMIPGGNNPAKRWPAERFGEIARRLSARGIRSAVSGSPGEAEVLVAQLW
jgi:heptosyltransferase-2